MRPTLFRQGNVKLLRYLGGGTKNPEYSKLIHAHFIEVSSRDNMLDRIGLYPKWGPLELPHRDDHAFKAAKLFKLRASDQEPVLHLYTMLSDVVGDLEDSLSNPPELDKCIYNNLMLVGLVEKGYLDEALIILRRELFPEHMVWNKDTYIAIFGLCARLQDLNLGRQVHNKLLKSDVVKSDDDESVHVFSALIKMYGKCKEISIARKVFDMCRPLRKVVIWNTVFAAYSESLEFDMPLKGFIKMRHEDDVAPNESTFFILLNASTELHSLTCGNSLHALTFKTGFKGCKKLEDTLINMYSRSGDIKAAEKVFVGMTDYMCDTTTWNAMINGYSLHSLGKNALTLFQKMLELGEDDPNEETFVGVLNACGHIGHVEQGFYYFYDLMKQKGVEPGLEHYRCIIDMLIKAGRLNEALSFIVSTPSNWDAFAWAMFLRGCYHNRNDDLHIQVPELIPDDVATKVSKWFGVAQIHEVLKIMAKKEEDEESWIEIKKKAKGYYSIKKGDRYFAGADEAMTDFLTRVNIYIHFFYRDHIKDIRIYERDEYHSEELALASALVMGFQYVPICIIKTSGKMCCNCHNLFKLTSVVVPGRLITVRDANQFHNFLNGKCSCGDYW